MDLSTFIVAVFCLTDDWLEEKELRQRGPSPQLSDSEVLRLSRSWASSSASTPTGASTPTSFRRHYAEWFSAPHRSPPHHLRSPVGQPVGAKAGAAPPPLGLTDFDPYISLVDTFPMPTCRFAQAYRYRRLPEESAFGYEEMVKQTFYGLRESTLGCAGRASSLR
jgi:hypothetical protein